MEREFIYVPSFEKKWSNLNLDDDDMMLLEDYIMKNPNAAVIMQGTGGLRKLRWPLPGFGKSSGIRALYVDFVYHGKIFMIDLFAKNEKDNLSPRERNAVKQVIQALEKELEL